MTRVAIVDDDPIVCSSLSTILKATGTAAIAWTACDGEIAVDRYEADNPDVLLIDVQMPVMDGLTASRKIIDAHSNAKILILTTFADESYIAKALEIGTKGYLIKQDVSSVIPAVQSVMAGQVVMGHRYCRNCTSAMPVQHGTTFHKRIRAKWFSFRAVSRISPNGSATCCNWSPKATIIGRSPRNCS